MTRAVTPHVDTLLITLINEIAAILDGNHDESDHEGRPFALVLDNYHAIEAQPIHDALTFLLEHMPVNMYLVIASRADPPLPLARLRARGQLTELLAPDLRFTLEQASSFLNQVMELALSAEDVAALEMRTEGWIAGLQLAALSINWLICRRPKGISTRQQRSTDSYFNSRPTNAGGVYRPLAGHTRAWARFSTSGTTLTPPGSIYWRASNSLKEGETQKYWWKATSLWRE